MRSLARIVWAALIVAAWSVAAPATASAEHTITLTFVRHAQSVSNASGVIDTSVPGPPITGRGFQQVLDVANELSPNAYDGIYASTMVRTQETAAPLSEALGEPVTVLPGLREIDAGVYEGQPSADAEQYTAALLAWLRGDRGARIPGSIDGNEFDARFDEAVTTIYDSGDANAVAFSHAAAMMIWALMNVSNPDVSLLAADPVPNTGIIVVSGNPRDGWTLVGWDGKSVSR